MLCHRYSSLTISWLWTKRGVLSWTLFRAQCNDHRFFGERSPLTLAFLAILCGSHCLLCCSRLGFCWKLLYNNPCHPRTYPTQTNSPRNRGRPFHIRSSGLHYLLRRPCRPWSVHGNERIRDSVFLAGLQLAMPFQRSLCSWSILVSGQLKSSFVDNLGLAVV